MKAGKLLHEAIALSPVKSARTIYHWRKANPRIDRLLAGAMEQCEELRVSKVTDALYNAALLGNTTAMIFYLKNKRPEIWKDVYDNRNQLTLHPSLEKMLAEANEFDRSKTRNTAGTN